MQTWERSRWRRKQRPLVELRDESLWRGDVFRFPFNPCLGPGSRPVEMLLFEVWGYEQVLGLVPTSGYKAGLPYCYFPPESQGEDRLSLETAWLHENWGKWLGYEEWSNEREETIFVPMPIEGTLVIRRSAPRPNLIV
jgi:hypothetical protein